MTKLLPLFVLAACTAIELPPPTVPSRVLSAQPTELGAPPPGQGTLVLDTGEPAVVEEVTGTTTTIATNGRSTAVGYGVSTQLVCTTPCTAHVAQGQHQLVLTRVRDGEWGGTARVDIGMHPVALRYALGHAEAHIVPRYLGMIVASFGLSAALYGGIASAAGDGGTTPLLGGAALTAFGAALMYIYRPEVQNGAGTQWDLDRSASR